MKISDRKDSKVPLKLPYKQYSNISILSDWKIYIPNQSQSAHPGVSNKCTFNQNVLLIQTPIQVDLRSKNSLGVIYMGVHFIPMHFRAEINLDLRYIKPTTAQNNILYNDSLTEEENFAIRKKYDSIASNRLLTCDDCEIGPSGIGRCFVTSPITSGLDISSLNYQEQGVMDYALSEFRLTENRSECACLPTVTDVNDEITRANASKKIQSCTRCIFIIHPGNLTPDVLGQEPNMR